MPSVQRTIIDSIRTALELVGFTVHNGIQNHHDGYRPKTRSYIEIAQTLVRHSTNITAGCISGPATLRLKYYQTFSWLTNSDAQAQTLEDNLQLMEKAFSQVRENGMQTKFDCSQEESTGGNNMGYTTFYTLEVVLATNQDRSEI